MNTTIEENARIVQEHYNHFFGLLNREKTVAEAGWERRPPIVNLGYWAHGACTSEEAQIAFVHTLASRLPDLREKRVLDAGCGVCGPATILAADYGAQVDCLNINEQQVAWGRKFVAGNRLDDQVRVHLANAMEIPFPAETFDVVFSLEAAHCFVDKPRFLAECFRVLRAGGTVLFSDITATTRDPVLTWQPALKLHLVTSAQWRKMFEAAGFTVTERKFIGKCVYPGYRRRLRLTAPARRAQIFNKVCGKRAPAFVRLARAGQAWALEWALCRSVLPIFSKLKLREYVLIMARKPR